MLNSQKSIFDYQAPFIFVSANEKWCLIAEIEQVNDGINLTVVEKKNEKFSQRILRLDELPFHIGAEVWELNYGSTLMTLSHLSLEQHPARVLWQEWIRQKQ